MDIFWLSFLISLFFLIFLLLVVFYIYLIQKDSWPDVIPLNVESPEGNPTPRDPRSKMKSPRDPRSKTRRDSVVEYIEKYGRTGDLLGVAYGGSLFSAVIKICTGSRFNHVVLLIRRKGKLQVLEVMNYLQRNQSGVLIWSLRKWLKINRRYEIVWTRYQGEDIEWDESSHLENLLSKRWLNNRKRIKLNCPSRDWQITKDYVKRRSSISVNYSLWNLRETINVLSDKGYSESRHQNLLKSDKYFCSQFVTMILYELKILIPIRNETSCSPAECLYGSLATVKGKSYLPPVRV